MADNEQTPNATHDKSSMALGMIMGAAAGIGAGMLMAPRSGQETRKIIKKKADTAKQDAQKQLNAKREKAMQVLQKSLEKSKNFVDKTADKSKEVVEKTSQRAKDAADKAQADVNANRQGRMLAG